MYLKFTDNKVIRFFVLNDKFTKYNIVDMLSFLPDVLVNELSKLNINLLSEIRLRSNLPTFIQYNGDYQLLKIRNKPYVLTGQELYNVLLKATNYSIYSHDDEIVKGYITANNGVRIGLAGELVYDNKKIVTIKNFSSICIRIPHDVVGVSDLFYKNFYIHKNVLVFTLSGVGKTTFIRDLTRNISLNSNENIVVIDERGEIFTSNIIKTPNTVDVLTYSSKKFGFLQGVRVLNAKYIIADELCSIDDVNSVINAINNGVNVIATIHASSIDDIKHNSILKKLVNNKTFEQYVQIKLENNNRIFKIFDKDFNCVC